jgi:cell wall-associated NlpC family hydrolase
MKGICHLSQIPIRSEAKSSAEMVTQLLYGETYQVLDQTGEWFKIKMDYDGYEGWLSDSSFYELQEENKRFIQTALIQEHKAGNDLIVTSLGSEVGIEQATAKHVYDLAIKFLGSPYLWGGRHFSGIDCSGFVQVVYKCLGIALPRDASQQQKIGKAIKPSEIFEGDLVFFEKNNKVGHVGIALRDKRIIHSHGKVRIDTLDEKGIFNVEKGEYTHSYHSTKRLR